MKKSKSKSFEAIYREHHTMVLQMCLGFVKGDRDVANDLSQETFISVWSNLEKFRGRSSYKTWIYRITVNTCLQYVKKDKKEKSIPKLHIENQISNDEKENVISHNALELYNAIGQLKKIDRLIIIMVLENQDYDDISKIIGIKPAYVRVKIHRIKKRLRLILNNNNNG